MANPVMTGGTHASQERYADSIVKLIRKEFNIRNDFSRDYEGEPTAGAVKIPVRGADVALEDYNILNGVNLSRSSTEYVDYLISKHKGFSELVDGYEAATVPDNLKVQRMESAGYSVGKALEDDAIKALIDSGTVEEDKTETETNDMYARIATTIKDLKKIGVKTSEMRVAISADTELKLMTDEKFSNSAGTLGEKLIREGVIGKVAGVNTKLSTEMSDVDDTVEYIVYATPWCQAVDEWKVEPAFNDIKDGKHIGASALQGRMVYEDFVTNKKTVRIKKYEA